MTSGVTAIRQRLSAAAGASDAPGRLARLLPVALLCLAAAGLGWRETGSIAPAVWLPYGVVAALVLATLLLARAARRPSPAQAVAVAALAALAVWSAISAAWAPEPSAAREEALLVLLYAVAFATALLAPRDGSDRLLAAAAVAATVAAFAVATGLRLALDSDTPGLFVDGRLQAPITYSNAQAAFFLVGFWPAVALAAARRQPLAVRALALGGATAMLAGWAATQSKGALVGLVLSAAVVVAVCPARLRLLVPALLAGAAVAPAFGALTRPFRAEDAALADAIAGTGRTLLWLAAAGTAVGLAYALADRRLALGPRARRRVGRAAAALAALLLAGGAAAALASVESPRAELSDRWERFKGFSEEDDEATTHLAALGSNRYDFWRVSLGAFADEPVTGIGARGFRAEYLLEGRSPETPLRAHSLALDVLSETGIVGGLLLLAALSPPLLAAARRARARKLPAAAALGACVYWLAHAAVDWTWTLPAAGIPFFLLLGVGASGGTRPRLRTRPALAAGGVALLAAVVLAAPWLSARLSERALENPERAASDLRWAKRLDPLSLEPYVTEARLAVPDWDAAVVPLEQAARKEPRSLAVRYVLGTAYLEAGRPERARAELRAALELSPGDPFVLAALERVDADS